MAKRMPVSAGLLLFREAEAGVEVFLAHPGGPFWADRDHGAWTIPKGAVMDGEGLLEAACREFTEETGVKPDGEFLDLGSIRQKAGKIIYAWAWRGDADPLRATSNTMKTEWPRRSGRYIEFPEIDRCAWFDVNSAKAKINVAQAELIDRLQALLRAKKCGAT